MKIEVWSDIMCPFCYIGKRKLEKSIADSPYKDDIKIEWKSYQLNPDLITDPTININEYLATNKGMSVDQAKQMSQQVSVMAAQEGLVFNFDKSVVANSFKAHVFAHFAKKYGKQMEAEELLFKGYFKDGANVDDIEYLKSITLQLGLDAVELEHVILDGSLDDEVKMDIHEAKQIGVKGVPFFVYDRKFAISGAQPQELFAQTLNQAFEEWSSNNKINVVNSENAQSCGPDGCN